jgi:hypothetical protein
VLMGNGKLGRWENGKMGKWEDGEIVAITFE